MRDLLPDKEFIGQWALITYFGITRQAGDAYKAVEEFHRQWPKQKIPIEMRTAQLSARGKFAAAAKVLAALDQPDKAQRIAYLQLLAQAGEVAKARGVAEKLAADFPDLKGVNLALADSWAASDKAKAMAYYRKELDLNPGNPIVLNNLAWEYGVVEGDLAKARPYLDKLKGLKNLDPRIHDTIGWILAVNGDVAEGERYVRNALQLVPDFPSFQYHLAYILKRTGKTDEARKLLEQALAGKQPFEERPEAEKLLAEQG
jgi:Flp pilus assembly protein TadD